MGATGSHKDKRDQREIVSLFRHPNCDHHCQKPPAAWQPRLWKQPEKEASPEAGSEPSGGRLLEKEVSAALHALGQEKSVAGQHSGQKDVQRVVYSNLSSATS